MRFPFPEVFLPNYYTHWYQYVLHIVWWDKILFRHLADRSDKHSCYTEIVKVWRTLSFFLELFTNFVESSLNICVYYFKRANSVLSCHILHCSYFPCIRVTSFHAYQQTSNKHLILIECKVRKQGIFKIMSIKVFFFQVLQRYI